MKKTLAVILAAVMLTCALASCGGGFDYDKVSLVEEGYVTLGDYKNITVDAAESSEPTDEDVYAHIAEHIGHAEEVATINDRAVEMYDVVDINFVGTMDGVEFEGGTGNSEGVVIGAGQFIPGFEEGIVGMMPGDTKDVAVKFPEDYHSEELAGKDAVFAITVNTLYDPAIIEDVRTELSNEETEDTLRADVWEALAECVTVNKYPESYVKELAKSEYNYYEYMYRSMGMMQDMEDLGVTMEGCTESAKSQIDREFAIYAIANAEGITATEEELKAKVNELVAEYIGYGYAEADAKSMFTTESVKTDVLYDKVIDNAIAALGLDVDAE